MSETREITVYTFEELSEDSSPFYGSPKDRARERIGQWLQEYANETLQEWFLDRLVEYGFPTDRIEWSLGWSQGDGMAYYGDVDVDVYLTKTGNVFSGPTEDLIVTIEPNSFATFYSHYNTMNVEAEWNGESRYEDAVEALRDTIEEDVRRLSRELERDGYAMLEVTDEMIVEHCEANEYRFLANGSVAP